MLNAFMYLLPFGYGELYISMSIYCLVLFYICQGGSGVIVKVSTSVYFGPRFSVGCHAQCGGILIKPWQLCILLKLVIL